MYETKQPTLPNASHTNHWHQVLCDRLHSMMYIPFQQQYYKASLWLWTHWHRVTFICISKIYCHFTHWVSEWVSEFKGLFSNIKVYVSCIIMTYPLESLSSLTWIGIPYFLAVFSSSKAYGTIEKREGMAIWCLPQIHDDTWILLKCAQHAPNSKNWDYSHIPGGATWNDKRPAHMVESDHHLTNRPPTPTHHHCFR